MLKKSYRYSKWFLTAIRYIFLLKYKLFHLMGNYSKLKTFTVTSLLLIPIPQIKPKQTNPQYYCHSYSQHSIVHKQMCFKLLKTWFKRSESPLFYIFALHFYAKPFTFLFYGLLLKVVRWRMVVNTYFLWFLMEICPLTTNIPHHLLYISIV